MQCQKHRAFEHVGSVKPLPQTSTDGTVCDPQAHSLLALQISSIWLFPRLISMSATVQNQVSVVESLLERVFSLSGNVQHGTLVNTCLVDIQLCLSHAWLQKFSYSIHVFGHTVLSLKMVIKIALYLASSIFRSTLTIFPVSAEEKHTRSMSV